MPRSDLRNIAIVAHVDHGKTTLVDAMLKQSGMFRDNEQVAERVMDSGDLERERGITILAKNTSLRWRGVKINIVDTPGHSDFGGEVERTLMMADGALLLVDAAEGPLPQTRFVLRKCLERAFPIIVVINKIDRQDARPDDVLSEVFDLFCDLEASDAQTDFPALYAVGRDGVAKRELTDRSTDLVPLFETILAKIPPAPGDPGGPLQIIICNLSHDDYVGRLAVGRIVQGTIKKGQNVVVVGATGTTPASIKMLFTFEGLKRTVCESAAAGENIAIAGIDEVDIGDTIATAEQPLALPRIRVEEPTLKMKIGVNTSPFAGTCKGSKFLTSRQLRERLENETKKNLAIKLEMTDSPDTFTVYGRGELQLAILVETMRREGYEMVLSNPEVVTREIEGKLMEPVELTSTRGTGLLNTIFDGWEEWGLITKRANGAIVADRSGEATPYALFHLQPRGVFFISPGEKVYEGMIIGEHNRPNDTDVNAVKEKKLSNIRNHGKDENVALATPRTLTIETAMEWIDADELVEVTADAVRVRKRILSCNARPRRQAALESAQAG